MPEASNFDRSDWHTLSADEVLAAAGSGREGLSSDEAQRRRERFGPNRLEPPHRHGPLVRFLLHFHNVLIYVLLAAAVVTALLGHWIDTGVILAVVVINAAIGFIQEGKAEKALAAVRGMLTPEATVLRDGLRVTIPAEEVVPGDVVLFGSGDKVPADVRLVYAKDLKIDEAMLTGESVPVEKSLAPSPAEAVLGDRLGMAFSGTLITYGQGRGVVVGTGDNTEIGRVSQMIAEVDALATPLLRQVDRFSRALSVAIVVLAALTFFFGWALRDYELVEMFLAAVSVAVAAIPEGLPAIMTITLAIGVQRMAGRHAIIRRLPAVDTLGSVTVICSDKTGTLTRNEMTVTRLILADGDFVVEGGGYAPRGGFRRFVGELEREAAASEVPDDPSQDRQGAGEAVDPAAHGGITALAEAAALCNDASVRQGEGDRWEMMGDPTEGALITLAMKARLDPDELRRRRARLDEIPFESENRYMATLNPAAGGGRAVFVKGAPERILEMCSHQGSLGAEAPLDRAYWEGHAEAAAAQGRRVLALAARHAEADEAEVNPEDIAGGLTLLGMVGIIDPPRHEAVAAIAECQRAGIRVKMITGDHAVTARAIGRRLGIGDGTTSMTGRDVDRVDDVALEQIARDVDVFARVSPEHKLRLVRAIQARGEVVAMTGDGVNDAPALKRADVGVAMGIKGTEVSKEASDMVLTDDNFASIAHAVEEGRTVYDNLRKAILFLLPTNGSEALVIILAILLGRTLPITPVQILWVNMITAVTLALALAFEPTEADVMERPPRDPRRGLLDGFFAWRIFFVSVIICAGTFGLFILMRAWDAPIELARTVAVNTLVVFQAWYLLNTRFLRQPVLSPRGLTGNPYILAAIALVILFQLTFTYLPLMQRLFGSAGIPAMHWLMIVAVASTVFFLVELEKLYLRRHQELAP